MCQEESRIRSPRVLHGDCPALSSAWHPAKRDHHTQEKQNPSGNMILLHYNFCFNNLILFPFNFPARQATLRGQSSSSLTPPSISIDLFKEGGEKPIAQDIFHFNFTVSITHSYFGKAQGNTLLLILLPLDPTFTSLQLNTMSCQSHTMCHNPSVETKRNLGRSGRKAKRHGRGPSLAGLLGQGLVPKLSKLHDGPSCKPSNAFIFLLHPILLAGVGL